MVAERNQRYEATKSDIEKFANVFFEADMYLDDEVRAIVSRLDRMWIELRAGFNMHVMYARKEMPYNKHMEQAYEKAFGLNISDELKEMESIVEKRMQAINDKVQNMIQGQ